MQSLIPSSCFFILDKYARKFHRRHLHLFCFYSNMKSSTKQTGIISVCHKIFLLSRMEGKTQHGHHKPLLFFGAGEGPAHDADSQPTLYLPADPLQPHPAAGRILRHPAVLPQALPLADQCRRVRPRLRQHRYHRGNEPEGHPWRHRAAGARRAALWGQQPAHQLLPAHRPAGVLKKVSAH